MFCNYPIVKFDNIEYPEVIKPHNWKNEKYEKFAIMQIPLILSWAITIHKSQGLSLEKALINIGSNIFEFGQTYVALSRVKSLKGLYLQNINIHRIRANKKVKLFYENLNNDQVNRECVGASEENNDQKKEQKSKSDKISDVKPPNKKKVQPKKCQIPLDQFFQASKSK